MKVRIRQRCYVTRNETPKRCIATVSRNVERMRANGWLTVTATDSGHKQQLTLTRQGKRLLGNSVSAWDEAQTRTRALLGRRGSDSICSLGNAVWSRMGID